MESRKEATKNEKIWFAFNRRSCSDCPAAQSGSNGSDGDQPGDPVLCRQTILKDRFYLLKIGWGFLGFMALMASASNIPAVIRNCRCLCLYVVYKNWNKPKTV